MRRFALFAVCLFFTAPARADEASKRAKIEEMLVISRTEANMKQMTAQSGVQAQQIMKGMMGDQPLSASDRKVMDNYLSKVMALLTQALDWQAIKPQFVDLYAAAYNEAENRRNLSLLQIAGGPVAAEQDARAHLQVDPDSHGTDAGSPAATAGSNERHGKTSRFRFG